MRRSVFFLLVSALALLSFVSIPYSVYRPGIQEPLPRDASVSDLKSASESWLGVKVRVQGKVDHLEFIPEGPYLPYGHALMDPVTEKFIGLDWPTGNLNNVPYNETITVVGEVVKGYATRGSLEPVGPALYYLRAERVQLI